MNEVEEFERERNKAILARIEAERITIEESIREAEARRVEEARPDVEKIHEFGEILKGMQLPEIKSELAQNFFRGFVESQLEEIADICLQFKV